MKARVWLSGARMLVIASAVAALFLGGFLLIPDSICINALNTLDEAATYARYMPELPPMENTNMVRPEYDAFYRKNQPGYLTRKWRALTCLLGIHTRFTWSPLYFRSLLESSLIRLQQHKIEKNIVFKMTPKETGRIVVIGALYGAYHSLVRDLQKLQELKIIDNSFKVVAPDTAIVILGSAVSRAPYGLETLGLILRLLEMNLDTVVYLRGNHEDNKYWEAFGLKDQLAAVYGKVTSDVVATINNIFMRLPLGLYIAVPGAADHFVKISYLGGDESTKLKEETYAHFLSAPQSGLLDRHQITKTVSHNSKIVIDVAFHGEKKRQTFQASSGLRLLPGDSGWTTWTLFSAPTLVNQKGFHFVNDAFAIIQVAPQGSDWMITEYAQDSTKVDGFKTREYQFFTGALWSEKKAAALPVEPVIERQPEVAAAVMQEVISSSLLSDAALTQATQSHFVQLLAGRLKKRRAAATAPEKEAARAPQAESSAPRSPSITTLSVPLTITIAAAAGPASAKLS